MFRCPSKVVDISNQCPNFGAARVSSGEGFWITTNTFIGPT